MDGDLYLWAAAQAEGEVACAQGVEGAEEVCALEVAAPAISGAAAGTSAEGVELFGVGTVDRVQAGEPREGAELLVVRNGPPVAGGDPEPCGDVDVWLAEDDEEVARPGILEGVGHVQIGVHARLEHRDAPETSEVGGVGVVVEGAGDEQIEASVARFARSGN